jgi:hypothetical protein
MRLSLGSEGENNTAGAMVFTGLFPSIGLSFAGVLDKRRGYDEDDERACHFEPLGSSVPVRSPSLLGEVDVGPVLQVTGTEA